MKKTISVLLSLVLLLFTLQSNAQNSFGTATQISVNTEATGNVCAGNDAYYKTNLPDDGMVTLCLEAKNTGTASSYIYAYTYDQGQGQLSSNLIGNTTNIAPGTTVYDTFRVYCRTADLMYFRIQPVSQCFDYKIKYLLTPAGTVRNDTADNETFSTANYFAYNDSVSGRINHVSAAADANDYYKTFVPQDGPITIYMEGTNTGNSSGYFVFNSYDKSQNQLTFNYVGNNTSIAPGTTVYDTIKLYCRASDTMYMRVSAASQCFNYKLKYSVGVVDSVHLDNGSNDSFNQAVFLPITDTAKGRINYTSATSTDNNDYYKGYIAQDGQVTLYIQATNTSNASGYAVVQGFDRIQNQQSYNYIGNTTNVAPGVTVYDTIKYYCRYKDSMYFRVVSAAGCFSYKLHYGVDTTEAVFGDSDNNDAGFQSSNYIAIGDTVKGHIGHASSNYSDSYDYYKGFVPQDGVITMYLQAKNTGNSSGYLVFTSYDKTQNQLSYNYVGNTTNVAPGVTVYDTIKLYCRSTDTMYFRVQQASQCFNYKFRYEVDANAALQFDGSANDVLQQATLFTVTDTVKASIGYVSASSNDQNDYYKTFVPQDGTVRVFVKAKNTSVNNSYLYLNTYDNAGNQMTFNYIGGTTNVAPGITVYDTIDLHCRLADTMYFGMHNGGQCWTYSLSYKVIPAVASGTGDSEPNNTFAQAVYMNAADTISGSINYIKSSFSDNDDYFKTKLVSDGNVRVYIQAKNTSTANGYFLLQAYDAATNNVLSSHYIPNSFSAAPGVTIYDTVDISCMAEDTMYFRISGGSQCFSYKLSYEVMLPRDTTVYVCTGYTTNIGSLYNTAPFTQVKYENLANPGVGISPNNVPAGSYRISVYDGTRECSRDTALITVANYPQPMPSFTTTATQCFNGNSFTFNNTSTISAGSMTYQWNFGDNGTSTSVSPVHTYGAPGTYSILLIATSNNGCIDSVRQSVIVYTSPAAGYSINNSNQCVNGNAYTFTNTSTISCGTMTYAWSFGDASSSTSTSPSHTYAASGTYNVKLVVTSNFGCKDSVTQTITVYPKPTPSFTINNSNQCVNGNAYTFTNTSTISSGSMTYAWSFGDATSSTSTSPSHTYAASGTYNVKLVVTSNFGCKDSVTQTITVYPKPTPAFTINNSNQCVNGNAYTFTNTSAISSGTMTYVWDFGDASSSTSTSPSHTYATSGTYNVKLVVTSNFGCKDSVTQTITVYPKPTPAFTINNSNQCVNGNAYTFTNTSAISSGTMTYAWSFGDASSSTSTSPSHTYAASGTYNVKLVVTSNFGCKDSVTQTITVYPKPTPSFTINNANQCVNGNTFAFTNTSTISSGTMTYAWDFGDASSSTSTSPSHTYAASGTYNVKLVVTSNFGCKDSLTQIITVYPKPTPAFTINNSNQCANGNAYTFTNTSTISSGTMSYTWDFGDASTSTSTSPSHTYASSGTYNVKLVVTSNFGCKDSLTQIITVYPKPTPAFTINNANQCVNGNAFTFTNTSTISSGTMTFVWDFGDASSSTSTSPSHTYAASGTYNVKLVVTSNFGCKDSVTQIITVYPKPTPAFTINNANQCVNGNTFAFTNTSTISSGTMTYAWDFGDASSSTSISPLHTYASSGTYNVKLVVTSNFGCKDSLTQIITVYPKPTPSFTINNANQCVNGNTFAFTNTSTISSGTMTYAWDFGDASSSTSTSPSHTYASSGTYNVKLVVTSNFGCKDSLTQIITVYPKPNLGADTTITMACNNGTTDITVLYNTASYASVVYNTATPTTAVPGIYQLIVTTINGCKDTANITVNNASVTDVPTNPVTKFASRECTDVSGWTHYYNDNGTPTDYTDDILILSLKKNGNSIGTLGDGTFTVKTVATAGAGTNSAVVVTNPLLASTTFYAMNRYWQVTPTQQPAANSTVGVRFYYNNQDLADVNGSYPTHNINHQQLTFYKVINGSPDPTTNLAGAQRVIKLTNGAIPDTNRWVYNSLTATENYAEFLVSSFSGGSGGANSFSVVAVSLVDFNAALSGADVRTHWTTADESRIVRYIVERSKDGFAFNAVSTVNAAGAHNYTFTDPSVKSLTVPVLYYRLRIIHTDGSFDHSQIIPVRLTAKPMITVYPNPATSDLYVDIHARLTGTGSISITDMKGAQVLSKKLQNGETSPFRIDVSGLSRGIYFIRVETNAQTYTQKFIKE